MLYGLFAVNAFLTWDGLAHANPAMAIALRVALGLSYAFSPFLVAVLFARIVTKNYAEHPTQRAFLTNLEIMWSITLALACFAFVVSLA